VPAQFRDDLGFLIEAACSEDVLHRLDLWAPGGAYDPICTINMASLPEHSCLEDIIVEARSLAERDQSCGGST
jgi:hypothetical protein